MLIEQLYKKRKSIERVDLAIKKFDLFEKSSNKKIGKKVLNVFLSTIMILSLLTLFELIFINFMPFVVKLAVFFSAILLLILFFINYETHLMNKNSERIKKRKKNFIIKKNKIEKESSINEENIDALFNEIKMMRENNSKINVPKEFICSIVDFKESIVDLNLESKIDNVIDKEERLKNSKSNKIINT